MGATPTQDTWRSLLPAALRIIDSVRDSYGVLDFRMGGGTVLMFRFGHRVSKDIDLFTHDAQALAYLSPRLNDAAGQDILEYQEQANAIKFVLPLGDIDVIVAGDVIQGQPMEALEFEGRTVLLDPTAEILAKKLLYRAESFKARDVFDMAVALALDRPAAIVAIQATTSARPALLRRLHAMAREPQAPLMQSFLPTPAGRAHIGGMVHTLIQAIEGTGAAR